MKNWSRRQETKIWELFEFGSIACNGRSGVIKQACKKVGVCLTCSHLVARGLGGQHSPHGILRASSFHSAPAVIWS